MNAFALALFAASAHALVARTGTCCFSLSASGSTASTVGQLADGQNRVGGGLSPATYCINGEGITDGKGRGCILTPSTAQFQCDAGAPPTTGFSIVCDGTVLYNESSTFFECPTGDNGEYNIYTTPPSAQQGCQNITLDASGCHASCVQACPTTLNGTYEYPHLIVPVDSSQPGKAYGTSYNGQITSTFSSIFNFDIPSSDSGKTCSLIFLLPLQSQLQTSSFNMSGAGTIGFSMLAGPASANTSYANAPAKGTDYGTFTVTPGGAQVIATFPCPAGKTIAHQLHAVGNTEFNYFQDYNPSPIGLTLLLARLS